MRKKFTRRITSLQGERSSPGGFFPLKRKHSLADGLFLPCHKCSCKAATCEGNTILTGLLIAILFPLTSLFSPCQPNRHEEHSVLPLKVLDCCGSWTNSPKLTLPLWHFCCSQSYQSLPASSSILLESHVQSPFSSQGSSSSIRPPH